MDQSFDFDPPLFEYTSIRYCRTNSSSRAKASKFIWLRTNDSTFLFPTKKKKKIVT